MKKYLLILAVSLLSSFLFSQNAIGYVKNKNTSIYYNSGSRVFFCSLKSSGYTVSCVDLDSAKITETQLSGASGRISSSYVVVGINNFYLINQVAKKDDRGMFPDVIITSWDGKTEPKKYEFPGRWNGELRYAIANDRDIYFMLDVMPASFSEESVYRTKHSLLHLNLVSGTLSEIPCPLSMNYSEPQCSFWCPLRIGDNFTEWYRTKMVNKKFSYEITRLDINGREVWTKTIASQMSKNNPDFVPELPRYCNNVLSTSSVWSERDTVRKITSFSLLTIAPLNYVPETNQYFSVAHVSEFKEKYKRGVCVLLLDSALSVVQSVEHPSLIQGHDRMNVGPQEFESVSVFAAFTEAHTPYLSVVFKKRNGKVIDKRMYKLVDETPLAAYTSLYSFEKMTGNFFPGYDAEKKRREQLSALPADALNDAMFLCTPKGTLYYLPDEKDVNVFFVK